MWRTPILTRPSNWNTFSFRRLSSLVFGQHLKDVGLEAIAIRGGFNFIGLAVATLSTFGIQFILGKTVSPADVGIFNLGFTISSLVGLVMLMGLDRGVMRYIAHYLGLDDRQHELGVVVAAFRVLLVLILVIMVFFWPLLDDIVEQLFHKPELTPVLYVFTACLPFLALTRLAMGILVGYKQVKPMVVIEQILMPLLRIILALAIVLLISQTITAISYSYLLAAVIGCGLAGIALMRLYRTRRGNFKPLPVTSELLQFSWPLLFAGLLNRTNTYTETLILGGLSSSEQVGFYTVALKISIALTIFFEAFNGIWAPYIAEAHTRGDMAKLASQFKTVTYWVFAVSLPFALWMFLEAPAVMAVFGTEYISSAGVLQILVLSQVGYVLGGMSALTLIMTGYSRMNLSDLILTVILSLLLDFTLIPAYGAIGAAIASAIAVIFLTTLRSGQVYLLLKIHPFTTAFIKPLLAGAAASLIAIAVGMFIQDLAYLWQLILAGIAIGLIYGGLMIRLHWRSAMGAG
jgi:O-antigen/teichoic acid export membrane protein